MGKYLLLERLATGGMAEVYRARAQGAGGFEKQVAIKRILPSYSQNDEFRKMFEYEARLSSMLTQANIVQIFDFNKFGETYLLAMEYIDGKNLRQFVNKARKVNVAFPIEFSVFVINEVCKGLDYAHAKKDEMTGQALNIIHRDMSPQNIMLSYEGAVKIVDFGIAKAKDRVDETRSGIIKGKFGYMSPEQANGLQVDHRTDLFSTGIILWELLTGRRLFAAESDMATLRMIQECVITPPSKINPRVPPELERIVMKVLSKDLTLRYSSAGDLHRHLLEFLSKNASTFTQREVSEVLQKAFADEIEKEKKRFEQLNRQSIPYSQGVSKRTTQQDDGMRDVADALDGMDTKSDVVDQAGETFGDEVSEGMPFEGEGSRDSNPADATSVDATKSQVSVPTEGAAEEQSSIKQRSINLRHGQKDLELVLPGGNKHSFQEDPPAPGPISQKRKGAQIVSMEGGSGNTEPGGPAEPKQTEEPELSQASIAEFSYSKTGDHRTEAMPKLANASGGLALGGAIPAPPRNPDQAAATGKSTAQKIDLSPSLDVQRPLQSENDVVRWGQVPIRDNRAKVRRKKRVFHPIIPLLAALAMTGYVYKLYIDGAVGEFIEQNSREPSHTKPLQAPTGGGDVSAEVDRKPVGDCTLEVRSQPSGALVKENKVERGLSPLVLSGPCNRSINIEILKDGYEYLSENVVISPKVTEWNRALKPIPTGRLVLSLGFNASVFINGEHLRDVRARVPADLPLRAHRTHKVRLVNPALKLDVESSVQIEEGQNSPLTLSLEEALARTQRPVPASRKKR